MRIRFGFEITISAAVVATVVTVVTAVVLRVIMGP